MRRSTVRHHTRPARPLAAAAAAFLLAAGLLTGCGDGDETASCDFDSAEWAELNPEDDDEGARMSELGQQLIDCGTLDDATRAEVADLLGEGGTADAPAWEYMMGATMIDFQLLVVEFGPDDTVTRVYTSQT